MSTHTRQFFIKAFAIIAILSMIFGSLVGSLSLFR